ncbi:MAG: ATP-dependent zinc metalloprotease FtsH [Acidobacteria bacterium]|nr:ATP-dependent zinc metalloprotease FtsH [Acidobacteriota bacterium]MCI0724638.1 ATP-dependent zinc metalloprotease FtsH [Acidobacteriota bacterium]
MRKRFKWLALAALILIAGFCFYRLQFHQPLRELTHSEFLAEARSGRWAEVHISETELVGLARPEKSGVAVRAVFARRLPGVELSGFLKELETLKIPVAAAKDSSAAWTAALGWFFPLVLLLMIASLVVWRTRHSTGGLLLSGSDHGKIYDQSSAAKVTFDDVAGVDESKAELVEIVDFLKNPQKYQQLGGRIPKGVLLVGPPGTGKTLLAKAVAGEADVSFFSISASEFIEMFVGVGAARVRHLFERAKRKAPCIVFIDELDAIGKSRSDRRHSGSHDEREQTLNQLLVEMDGFDPTKGIIVIAATNTPEVLDPALVRTGRFDRQVLIDRPDLRGREAVLRIHSRHVRLSSDVELHTIAARTPGMVGADLANIMNEAALLAARRAAAQVEMRDVEEAIDRVMLGLEKKTRVMDEQEKERVAYHETGHALVALSMRHADPVHRVSIIPRSIGALGHVLQLPTQEKFLLTQPELEDRLAVMLGGRVAEDIIYEGVVSTGANNDLERASELARQMVTHYGMSAVLGPMTYGKAQTSQFLSPSLRAEDRNYSEQTAETIDAEVRRIVDETYERVRGVLLQRREELGRIAAELMRKETLSREELWVLLSPSSEILSA